MNNYKKVLLIFLLVIGSLSVSFASNKFKPNNHYEFRDSDLGEGKFTDQGEVVILDKLPAVFTFIPEPQIYFHSDTTLRHTDRAVARLGELVIDDFEDDFEYLHSNGSYVEDDSLEKVMGEPEYIYNLYMQSNGYSAYNNQPNLEKLTYYDGTTKKELTVELIAICHGVNTYYVNLAAKNWNGNNPPLANNNDKINKFYEGDRIEFYLLTQEKYDPALILSGTNKAKLKSNAFRDIFKLSYRCGEKGNNNKYNRYETTGSGIKGNPYITSDMITDGICYNALPGEVIRPTWDFLLEPTTLADSLDPSVNYAQTIALASVTPRQNYENKSFSVLYSFDSLKNTNSNSFYMSNDKVQLAKIKYDLSFTPHPGYIEKGKEYVWHIDSKKEQTAELKVHNLATNAINALSGNWSDTIIVTVKSTDNTYTSST